MNLDAYDYLSMIVKTDGRPYMFNVRCRERATPFVYQARLKEEDPKPMQRMEVSIHRVSMPHRGTQS